MLKRIICICLCVLLLFTAFSCAPSKKKTFEKDAALYFEQFENEQTAGKIKKTVKYSKDGSIAYSYPAKTGDKDFDKQLESYCETAAEEFKKIASKDDTLFIGYKSYSPAKDICGVEMHCKTTVGGNVNETQRSFNRGVEMTDNLRKLVTIEARDTYKNLDKTNLLDYTVTNDGINALYSQDGEELSVKVPFEKLSCLLPDALKTEGGRSIDITKKMVALTFDDGPHNTYTNKILDTLEKYDSVATFFEVGNLVSQGADTIKRADSLGCEIASHTWSHGNLQTLSLENIKSQINRADEALEKVTGRKPALLRPPYGAVGKNLLNNSDKFLIGWSVDTNDWKYRDKNKVVSSVKNAGDLDGDVVLMHSLYNSTAQAVEELVPWLIDNGYQLVTVSELIKYKYEDSLEAGKYYAYNYFDYN